MRLTPESATGRLARARVSDLLPRGGASFLDNPWKRGDDTGIQPWGSGKLAVSNGEDMGLLYLKVANSLRKSVLEGVYRPGERLPRQHDMARDFNVAFTTLKRALDVLELEGYVIRKVGQGTYASLPEERTRTALVVDDDEGVRGFCARALSVSGWSSVAVESGEAALARVKEQRFDVVLLDLIMPGMNGSETFRNIRGLDPGAYVVIITGYPDSGLLAEALEAGPFAVMKKPFSLDQLREVLANVPQRSAAAPGRSR